AMACALVSLLLLGQPSSPLVRRVMAGTLGGFGLLWVASEVVILWMPEEPDELLFRGLGAIAILTALGAILTPILERMSPALRRSATARVTRESEHGSGRAA
ncbi:MAG: hypothetical protein ACRDIZ_14920, partial [Actinomycetota bacterium]